MVNQAEQPDSTQSAPPTDGGGTTTDVIGGEDGFYTLTDGVTTIQLETESNLTEGQSGYQDFSKFGGLPTTSSFGTNGTGDVKFTTTGAGATGDAYQIIIRGIKQY